MAVERMSGSSSLIDVLDRILDKGVVIDAWARISLAGIDLAGREARIVVAAVDVDQMLAGAGRIAGSGSPAAPAESGLAESASGRARGGNRFSRVGRERGHR